MFAKINHVAIASDNYAMNGKFYEALFGMKPSSRPRASRSVVVGDGYVGMNHIPRREGRTSGLDHFGIQVEDIELAMARIRKFDPSLEAIKRPPIRPFADYSAIDPDTNIFDLSQKSLGNQKDVYAENDERPAPRAISHIALRTRHAERCAQFYAEVFELNLLNKTDENYHLSDGRVTLLIMPWKLSDYAGMDPARTGPDHIGFKVESVEAIKREMAVLIGENPHMATRPLGYGSEGKARLDLFKTCPLGAFQLTDLEGVYIDVAEH